MTLTSCVDCGEPSESSRCPEHKHTVDTKASAADRGYDWQWTKLSKRARRLQNFCTDCGSVDQLTADHLPIAWERKAAGLPIRLRDIEVVCLDCNIARGAARGQSTTRGDAPAATHPDPSTKANPSACPSNCASTPSRHRCDTPLHQFGTADLLLSVFRWEELCLNPDSDPDRAHRSSGFRHLRTPMPTSPPRVCNRCKGPAAKGKPCQCRPAFEGSTHPSSNDRRWQGLRKAKLQANPICEHTGCRRIAVEPDHITPLAEGGDRYDWRNLQSLCRTHHDQKTTADAQRGKTRAR